MVCPIGTASPRRPGGLLRLLAGRRPAAAAARFAEGAAWGALPTRARRRARARAARLTHVARTTRAVERAAIHARPPHSAARAGAREAAAARVGAAAGLARAAARRA